MASDTEYDGYEAVLDDVFEGEDVDGDEGERRPAVISPTRLLAVRRAIEARREAREMNATLNYLELDFEDEE